MWLSRARLVETAVRSSTATHSVMHRRYALNSPGQEPKSRFFDSYVTVHINTFTSSTRYRDLLKVEHGALAIYLIRYLNVPPARLPAEGDEPLESMPQQLRKSGLPCWTPSIGNTRSTRRLTLWCAISLWATRRN